jgi:lauroyl/myristoyl acyltransferase
MLGMFIARTTPPRFGYWLARRMARWMRRHRYDMFRTLRENLSYVVPEADDPALDDLAEEALFQASCCYFDMFHYRSKDILAKGIVQYDPEEWAEASRLFADERGTVAVGAHLSNYDLAAQWFVLQGFELQALSLPNPDRGDKVINDLRRERGIEVTPVSVRSLRDAVRRLRRGGVIITGVDRPVAHEEEETLFFGAPAILPRGHIRLALQTNSRALVVYCLRQPDGHYRLYLSGAIEMVRTGDRRQDIEVNTRRVLTRIEESIRSAPEQWVMLTPVWHRPRQKD